MEHIGNSLEDVLLHAEMIFEEGFDGILITAPDINDPTILYINQALCDMTGYRPEELLGKTPKILQGPKTKKAITDKLKQQLAIKNRFHGATVNYKKDGSEYHVEWKISRVVDKNNQALCYISVQRDLTFIKSFLSRLHSTTNIFRNLLNVVLHSDKTGKELASEGIFKQATDEELRNMTFFSGDLRSDDSRDAFGDELFFDGHSESGIMPVYRDKPQLSAMQFHRYSDMTDIDIASLCELIEDCVANIDMLKLSANPQSAFVDLYADLHEMANCIFFMDEFMDLSVVIGDLSTTLSKYHVDELEEFVLDTLKAMILDINTWLTEVFITKEAKNIYELEPSIIGSAKQLIFMLKN